MAKCKTDNNVEFSDLTIADEEFLISILNDMVRKEFIYNVDPSTYEPSSSNSTNSSCRSSSSIGNNAESFEVKDKGRQKEVNGDDVVKPNIKTRPLEGPVNLETNSGQKPKKMKMKHKYKEDQVVSEHEIKMSDVDYGKPSLDLKPDFKFGPLADSVELKINGDQKAIKRKAKHTNKASQIVSEREKESHLSQEKRRTRNQAVKYDVLSLRHYLKKKTSLENPKWGERVIKDLKYFYKMRKQLTSNEGFSLGDMTKLSDKWFDTYSFRFHELHNVTKMSISQTIQLFPGYSYYPLLAEDFLRDTKVDLKSVDNLEVWQRIIDELRDSEKLLRFKGCKQAVDLIIKNCKKSSASKNQEALVRNIGMTLLAHKYLGDAGVAALVVFVNSTTEVERTFAECSKLKILIVNTKSNFCGAKDDIFVCIERHLVGKVSDFYHAVLMCYALHYVFWLKYSPKCAPLYLWFDRLLNMPPS